MKSKVSNQVILVMIILFALLLCSYSCKSNSTVPIASNNKASDQTKSTLSDTQTQQLYKTSGVYLQTHISTIEEALASYQFSHGVLPERLEDLINGFIVFWPGCVYNDEPLMIMHNVPDPQNAEHIGKIYYERLNGVQAKLYYLDVDVKKSQDEKLIWEVKEKDVLLLIGDELNPDGSYKWLPPGFSTTPQSAFSAQDKFLIGFKKLFYLTVVLLQSEYLRNFGNDDTSFENILNNSKYYVLKKGLDSLNTYVSNGSIEFDIGACGNGTDYYYDNYEFNIFSGESKVTKSCTRVEGESHTSSSGKVLYKLNGPIVCPEPMPNPRSILNSRDPSTFSFSDAIIISGDELIYD